MFSLSPEDISNLGAKQDVKIFKRAAVLSAGKWRSIQEHLHPGKKDALQNEEDEKFATYLMKEVEEMTKDWENSAEKTRQRKDQEKKEEDERKKQDKAKRFSEIRKAEAKRRREQIARAQKIIERTKMTSMELESAAMLCEVLKVQSLQREMNENLSLVERERAFHEGFYIQEQAKKWIKDQQEKMLEKKERNKLHYKLVIEDSKRKEQAKLDEAKKEVEFDRKYSEKVSKEYKEYLESQKAKEDRKKKEIRQNLLEAIQMAEQRKAREKTQDEVETTIAEIFTEGKKKINHIKDQKIKAAKERAIKMKQANAERLAKILDDQRDQKEAEMRKLAVQGYTDAFQVYEQNRKEMAKIKRDALIKQRDEDMARMQANKEKEAELHRKSIETRLGNDNVDLEFEMQKIQEKIKICEENQAILMRQMQEREERERRQKEHDMKRRMKIIEETNQKDDSTFLEYADLLIKDANKKCRPLFPLAAAVKDYKKRHELELRPLLPRHLKSHVGLGVQDRMYEIKEIG